MYSVRPGPRMDTGELMVEFNSVNSALDGGEWSNSRPGLFSPRERNPQYPFSGRLGGPQSRQDVSGKRKSSNPAGYQTLYCPACNLVATDFSLLFNAMHLSNID